MTKKTLSIIAISAVGIAVASLAYAAVSTKYFQRIKQNTYTGSTTVAITQGDETTVVEKSYDLTNWVSGAVNSTTCNLLIGEGQSAAQVYAGDIVTKYSRVFTTKITGLPSLNTNTDPPTFYSKIIYYKSGKVATLPEKGQKTYTTKTLNSIIYCDGHDATTETVGSTPTVGTTKYTYKAVTLQPSN